jgi:hypothetical protein
MKNILFLLLICSQTLSAQPTSTAGGEINKPDKKILEEITKTIYFLADDKLEGRRTGTPGEKLAYEFITKQFKKNGLTALGDSGSFLQAFDVTEGKTLKGKNFLSIDNDLLVLQEDYFPMPYAANGAEDLSNKTFKTNFIFIQDLVDSNKTNPHFDLKESINTAIRESEKRGADIFFIFDTAATKEKFDEKDKTAAVGIPVFYLTASGTKKYFSAKKNSLISYSIETGSKTKLGHNVVGYINNNAKNTIILGAHYDHLGYGEDHNSLYSGTTPMIHNGADDNSSGTAALIVLSDLIKGSSLKNYNYLFVAFSGEELGLYGSKYFTEHSPVDLNTVNYMINMDMVGRLNDSTHGLNIGGYGTSPGWKQLIDTGNTNFKIKLDSSGTGPSDHTSFYRKNIPVLFFFTGTHMDYHKPTDDADKINYTGELAVIKLIYNIISQADTKDKLAFTKTREVSMGKSNFKVTLGIMPDYSFSGNGVRVDGVSDGRPAQKAGIQAGDVLYQLGEHSFSDVQTYMQTLNKFNKGDATKVKLKRGKEDMEFSVIF